MNYWILWLLIGIMSIAAGIMAIINPLAATLTAELLIGYMFMAIGILNFVSAFRDQRWAARIWMLILGALLTLLGFNLVAHPMAGILQLTLVAAAFMIAIGVTRLIIAFTPLAAGARGLMLISGLLSIVLAGMILTNFPASAGVVLGIYLAIELVSNGVSLIFLALDRKEAKPG